MRVVFTKRAQGNLDAIFTYVARDNPRAAREIVAAIQNAASLLADNPSLGRPTRVRRARILTMSSLPYRLSYEIRPDEVRILTIRHTSRRPLHSFE